MRYSTAGGVCARAAAEIAVNSSRPAAARGGASIGDGMAVRMASFRSTSLGNVGG
jgi:hypothetical protein